MTDKQPASPPTTKRKKIVKEYEFVGGDAAERVQNWVAEANQRLVVFEYNGRGVLKFPLSLAVVAVPVLFLFAAPFAWALSVGLLALGLLTKFSVTVERR